MLHPVDVRRMLEELAEIYRAEERAEAQRTARELLSAPVLQPFHRRPAHPHDALIRHTLGTSAHPAAAAILAANDHVPWGGNPVSDETPAWIKEMCAVAEIMGPDGPIHAPDLRLGLLFVRAGRYYPLHNHDADETYVMLAGEALWTAGDDIRIRSAGDMIHHLSLMPHAFRAGPEGFVALYRWSGDINTASYAFLDDPEGS